MRSITPDWGNVKPLGRTWPLPGEGLWLAFSGAGAEIAFTGCVCEAVLCGDSRTEDEAAVSDHPRIAIELDGRRVVDAQLHQPVNTFRIEAAAGEHVLRVVKLSETAMSTCVLRSLAAEEIRPTPRKARYIEFIGDSITCGYGVDDEDPEHPFSTATEDATCACPCLTAQMLDSDYSLVAVSGYGIISGYTATAEEPVIAQRLPDYYEKLGFSYGSCRGVSPQDVSWNFSARQPDLVVINLGTNDDSYCLEDEGRQRQFAAAYGEFLRRVRRCNPKAKILCTLGVMGDRLYPFVERAAAAYTACTGDINIACMAFAPQGEEDGRAVDYHPTRATHWKAAQKLTAEIRRLMNW